jgi:hypothetical protein
MASDKIGALWKSDSTNPKAPFAKGEIDFMGRKLRVVIWNNNKRPDKKDPDFTIALDKPREEGQVIPNKPSTALYSPDATKRFGDEEVPF